MLKNLVRRENRLQHLLGLSAFLFYALFLNIPSGYAAGVVILLLLSLWTAPQWVNSKKPEYIKIMAGFLLFFGIFMSHSFDSLLSLTSDGDYFTKYALGAVCILGASSIRLHPKWIAYAAAVGCLGSGLLAVQQFTVIARAEGYTNAIRFGNIALLMAGFCYFFACTHLFSKKEKWLLCCAGLAGVVASVLSLSRGGWLVIFIFPFFLLFFIDERDKRKKLLGYISGSMVLVLGILVSTPVAQERITLAQQEVSGYLNDRNHFANTSVGARLEQWRLSWNSGLEKPLLGWGVQGLKERKEFYLSTGEAHPSVAMINHSHNEFLEMWTSRGILGILVLLLFYGLPIRIFWPQKKEIAKFSSKNQSTYIAISVMGLTLPVGYFVFGWTDVFFNLSIGHNFFIFSVVFLLSSLEWLKYNDSMYLLENKNDKYSHCK